MKKLFITLLLFFQFTLSFSQWSFLTSTNASAIWLNTPDDGWAFRDHFCHWDGSSWDTVYYTPAFFNLVPFFTSRTDGWVFNFQDSAFRWDGVAWTKIRTGFQTDFCHFSDSTFGWAGNSDSVYRYSYGSWTAFDIPGTSNLKVVSCGSGTGWLLSRDSYQSPSTFYKYQSGSWVVDTVFDSIVVHDFYFVDPTHGWFTGYHLSADEGFIYKYDGNTWQVEQALDSVVFWTLYMVNNSYGWASGPYGIYVYNGTSWTESNSPFICGVQFSFGSSNYGWLLENIGLCDPASGGRIIYYIDSHIYGIDQEEAEEENNYRVYPNPSGDFIYLNSLKSETSAVSIYDLKGSRVFMANTDDYPIEIKTDQFTPGLYFIKVEDNAGGACLRFIKE